jgi:hypothetical protein
MGDVFRGEAAERKFTVTNVCPFPLTFSMLFRAVPDPNLQMKPPFYTRPSEGTLAQVRVCVCVMFGAPQRLMAV